MQYMVTAHTCREGRYRLELVDDNREVAQYMIEGAVALTDAAKLDLMLKVQWGHDQRGQDLYQVPVGSGERLYIYTSVQAYIY